MTPTSAPAASLVRHLLIIDPQNDFCDLPDDYLPANPNYAEGNGEDRLLQPTLGVPGAHADMQRLADFITFAGPYLKSIGLTLDSHQLYDIGHPVYWRHVSGAPFVQHTPVLAAQVRSREIMPSDAGELDYVLHYLDTLESQGTTHWVWPVHCEIGTWGHNVHADLRRAYNAWEQQKKRAVVKVFKGMNPRTESYSAVRAAVPDPADPATQDNPALWAALEGAGIIYVGGIAATHCVPSTVYHLLERIPASCFTLLTDAMSGVPGFESAKDAFFADMAARGVRMLTVSEAMNEILAQK